MSSSTSSNIFAGLSMLSVASAATFDVSTSTESGMFGRIFLAHYTLRGGFSIDMDFNKWFGVAKQMNSEIDKTDSVVKFNLSSENKLAVKKAYKQLQKTKPVLGIFGKKATDRTLMNKRARLLKVWYEAWYDADADHYSKSHARYACPIYTMFVQEICFAAGHPFHEGLTDPFLIK